MIIIEDKYIGKIYGCYEIVSRSNQKTNDGHIKYNCKCIHCGMENQMKLADIKYKKSDKCTHLITIGNLTIPCLNDAKDKLIPDYRLRNIFYGVIRRCYDSSNKDYDNYGKKGIDVAEEWLNNPLKFFQWSMENGYNNKLSIDRIDENKGYYPDNCRWIPISDNARFKSNTNYITATVTLSGRQWANLIPEHGVNYINRMLIEKGNQKTVEYLEERFRNKHDLKNT